MKFWACITLFSVLTIAGCLNEKKHEGQPERILECVLSTLLEIHKLEKSTNIFISDMQNWTDSSSYILVIIDTENLIDSEGEYWVTTYQGMKIHQYLGSVDTSLTRNLDDLSNTVPNSLNWKKEIIEATKDADEEISPPYNPPRVSFIYEPSKKCIKNFLDFKEIFTSACETCKG